mmetsp:Transcript_24112/g.67047  ORF Transcript_24112/g.67047 Transcript_24112/m.67047 type:complete len:268 (-) Transcript_24112:2374-3177(-)
MVRRRRRAPGMGRSTGRPVTGWRPSRPPPSLASAGLRKPSSRIAWRAARSSSSVGSLEGFGSSASSSSCSSRSSSSSNPSASDSLSVSAGPLAGGTSRMAAACFSKISCALSMYCCTAWAVLTLELRANLVSRAPIVPPSWAAALERSLTRPMSSQRLRPAISCLVTPRFMRIFSASPIFSRRRSELVPVMLPVSRLDSCCSAGLDCFRTSLRNEKPTPRPEGSPVPTSASCPRPSLTASTKLLVKCHGVACSSSRITLAAFMTSGS